MSRRAARRNRRSSRRAWLAAGALFACFLILTALVCLVDVRDVPVTAVASGTDLTGRVGLASLNTAVRQDYRAGMLKASKYAGYVCFLAAACFAVYGLSQMIRRRGVTKMDRDLWALCGLYAVTLALYVFFGKVSPNARPVILPGEAGPEASYPSSHTLLAVVVMGSAILELKGRLPARLRLPAAALCVLLMAAVVCLRFASGAHWLTDIAGGLLLGGALVAAFAAVAGPIPASPKA